MSTLHRTPISTMRSYLFDNRQGIFVLCASLAVMVVMLWYMGRSPFCPCGVIRLWEGDIFGPGNSQQLSDWYSFSHVIHGFVFWYLMRRLLPRSPLWLRLFISLVLEIGWELVENSPLVIDRYRSTTSSIEYTGDSILNSASDVLMMVGGFAFASRMRWQAVLLCAVVFEVMTTILVRDGLILNIIMLTHPFSWIKAWQLGIKG